MTAVPFDTLKLAQGLEAGGFSPGQARAAVMALSDAASVADLATKTDLLGLRAELLGEIGSLRTELKNDIALVKNDIALSEQRLTIRLGGMLVVAVGVLLAAMRYQPAH